MEKLRVTDMISTADEHYALVVGVAKRARQIAKKADEEKQILTVKPVQLAMEEYDQELFEIKVGE